MSSRFVLFVSSLTVAALSGCAAQTLGPNAMPEEAVPALRALASVHGLDPASFVPLRDELSAGGRRHVHVRQIVHGVPVWGGEAIVHLDEAGEILGATDDLLPAISVDPRQELDAEAAISVALAEVGLAPDAPPVADRFALRTDRGDRLAWRVRMERVLGGAPTRPVLFVDAADGSILLRYDDLQTSAGTGVGQATYSGEVEFGTYAVKGGHTLEDVERGVGLCTHTYKSGTRVAKRTLDADNAWEAASQSDAVEIHYGLTQTYDLFLESFGRDGADGAGGPWQAPSATGEGRCLSAYADYDRSYVNAFWTGTALYFGDGDGVTSGPLVSPDIVGHELAHGVTQYSAGLIYYGESGGLNEAMSDIFGALVERRVRGEDNAGLWMVGEEVWTPDTEGDALRYMAAPADDGSSLDYYTASAGGYDVHYSSGIANLAFYLLSEGGAHPRLGGDAVTGIGAEAAGQIFYTALTSYMTAKTDFAGALEATEAAAEELYGADSAELVAVQAAWAAVGVTP